MADDEVLRERDLEALERGPTGENAEEVLCDESLRVVFIESVTGLPGTGDFIRLLGASIKLRDAVDTFVAVRGAFIGPLDTFVVAPPVRGAFIDILGIVGASVVMVPPMRGGVIQGWYAGLS